MTYQRGWVFSNLKITLCPSIIETISMKAPNNQELFSNNLPAVASD